MNITESPNHREELEWEDKDAKEEGGNMLLCVLCESESHAYREGQSLLTDSLEPPNPYYCFCLS